ncbi:GntR family transcriptional regulator [Alloacidobacterium dinghuense]|uniref:GntR family transcriptional regulator n=1 Tax=Alloacidobacterium dinghuense TaxID=2763107 RepID=A0A7G8BH63_9BACT|nr:GntR family transcriptional regulator [Alloacidobacterium dinghuense]QNI31883.1 GntR family transcriptional regulator [Alloacidobacterium dinghuense]
MNLATMQNDASLLIKQSLAAKLREEIIEGHLAPGQRIIEGYWARKFGVAQTSVREAINLLINEGFATKASGRSARVTSYSESDIAQIYELRGALEGLAARLTTERQPDLDPLESSLKELRKATKSGDIRALIEADLHFHLCLCELCGNRFLYSQIRTLLVPLFAFVAMRVVQSHQTAQAWESDLDRHKRIIELIREGDPFAAEFVVRGVMQQFAARAYAIWQTKDT